MRDDDKRHGITGYRNGCRCATCRRACADAAARRRARKYLARTDHVSVPNLGTKRRIQALVALGWSMAAISRHAGYDRSHVGLMLSRRGNIRTETARRIAATYERLSMTLPPQETRVEKVDAARARRIAKERGWLPPMAWVDIDDPNERPDLQARDNSVDEVVVLRVLGGDFSLTVNRAERYEIVRRWQGSDAELERHTGWNVPRLRREMARPAQEVA